MNTVGDTALPEISDLELRLAFARAASELPRESWYRKKDERAGDTPISLQRWKLVSANIRHLSSIIGQLEALLTTEESDEYGVLRASERAYDLACHLLIDGAIVAAKDRREIPLGRASTDAEGGVRIEWVRPTSSVHLVIPVTANRGPYIYREVGRDFGTEPATPEVLASWLRAVEE